MRREIDEACREAAAPDQTAVANTVRGCGGRLTHTFHIQNAVSALLPGTAIRTVADHPLVAHVVEDARTEAELNISAQAINCATFWNAGQTGGSFWNATLDTGVDTGHPSLSGILWWEHVSHDTAKTRSEYNDTPTSTDDFHGHGTHVAGIMSSGDALFRGIAYGSTRSTNLKAGYRTTSGGGGMYQSDAMDAVQWGLSNATIDAINLSFGSSDPMDNEDDDNTRFWDGVIQTRSNALPSRGNEGGTEKR